MIQLFNSLILVLKNFCQDFLLMYLLEIKVAIGSLNL